MPPDDLREALKTDRAVSAHPVTARLDPVLTIAPVVADAGRSDQLDPARATSPPKESPPPGRQRMPLGLCGSLALHLLPLLVLMNWNGAPAEVTMPIPVQLVLEAPPPPPPPPPAPDKKPPPGPIASRDMGEPAGEPDQPAAHSPAPPADQPGDTETAAVAPPPQPAPQPAPLPPEPKPLPPVTPPVRKTVAMRAPPNPYPARRETRVPGPAATRDEYLAYCESLIRRNNGMLPDSFIGGRRGATRLSILVLDDGTIASVAVARSSGYPDIDERIEQMVAAVRRFPPLPQWDQQPSAKLIYVHVFPGER